MKFHFDWNKVHLKELTSTLTQFSIAEFPLFKYTKVIWPLELPLIHVGDDDEKRPSKFGSPNSKFFLSSVKCLWLLKIARLTVDVINDLFWVEMVPALQDMEQMKTNVRQWGNMIWVLWREKVSLKAFKLCLPSIHLSTKIFIVGLLPEWLAFLRVLPNCRKHLSKQLSCRIATCSPSMVGHAEIPEWSSVSMSVTVIYLVNSIRRL